MKLQISDFGFQIEVQIRSQSAINLQSEIYNLQFRRQSDPESVCERDVHVAQSARPTSASRSQRRLPNADAVHTKSTVPAATNPARFSSATKETRPSAMRTIRRRVLARRCGRCRRPAPLTIEHDHHQRGAAEYQEGEHPLARRAAALAGRADATRCAPRGRARRPGIGRRQVRPDRSRSNSSFASVARHDSLCAILSTTAVSACRSDSLRPGDVLQVRKQLLGGSHDRCGALVVERSERVKLFYGAEQRLVDLGWSRVARAAVNHAIADRIGGVTG